MGKFKSSNVPKEDMEPAEFTMHIALMEKAVEEKIKVYTARSGPLMEIRKKLAKVDIKMVNKLKPSPSSVSVRFENAHTELIGFKEEIRECDVETICTLHAKLGRFFELCKALEIDGEKVDQALNIHVKNAQTIHRSERMSGYHRTKKVKA